MIIQQKKKTLREREREEFCIPICRKKIRDISRSSKARAQFVVSSIDDGLGFR
jgi:hypothetical protein